MEQPRMINLKDLTPEELTALVESLGEKPFRAGQIRKWLFKFGVDNLDDMTDLSRSFRARLAENAFVHRPVCLEVQASRDGTRKYLWELADGNRIESVLIPERDHFTLCVSSQVGCAMGCRFCRTAEIGLKRNLSPGEIVDQVLGVRAGLPEGARLTNLVFMGMGEPLANRENVVRSLAVLTEPGLIGLSKRHISLSTVGLAPELPRLAEAVTVGLTVSLNAADDRTRDRLMPINRRYPMGALHRALQAFPLPRGRRITVAYVLLAGVNDSPEDAVRLSRYLHGLKVKINLIPFNPFPGAAFERSDDETMSAFQEILIKKRFTAIIRKSKGRDVAAACGQLAGGRDDPSGT